MEYTDKIAAVDRMRQYIVDNLNELNLDDLCASVGYSKFYAIRMFKDIAGKTPFEYARALRLTKAAEELRDSGGKVIDAAFQSGFDSHDGFTRAFMRQFKITPQKYIRETPPISYFIPYAFKPFYNHRKEGEYIMRNEKVSQTVTVTAVERPARKLILLRCKTAFKSSCGGGDYFAFCEEMGCDWEGLLSSIPEKFTTAALMGLPQNLVKPGTADSAAGVEVPADYNKPLPEGYEMIDLPPCTMLFFNGAPFENGEDFGIAIDIVFEAIANYNFELYGWQAAPELAPHFNFGTPEGGGARMAIPVKAK